MKKKKEAFYNKESEFNFIYPANKNLDKTQEEPNKLVGMALKKRDYEIDWEDIRYQYKRYLKIHGSVPIHRFAFNYVLGCELQNRIAPQDKIIMQAMYIEICAELQKRMTNI